jgi:hypothetical protein
MIRKRLHFSTSLEKSAASLPYFSSNFIGAKLSLPGVLKSKFKFQNYGEVPISTMKR